MKILVLSHEFPPIGGGGGHVARDLCQGLAGLGHEIKVLTAALLGGAADSGAPPGSGYELIRTPTLRRDPARANILAMSTFMISALIRGLALIRDWKPDLIHVHFAVPAGPVAWLLSKLTGVPYVLTVHLGDVPGGTPEKTAGWFKLVKPFTYPVWNDARKVVAVSNFTRQLALKHYRVEIDVIHNGVDLRLYQQGQIIVHDPPLIVFAGRFVPQKNPLLVVRTLASLKNLDWELVMMGDGELFEKVKQEVQLNGLEDRVSLLGWVSPGTVKKKFLESDILFMPSLSEGLPVVGVQALASGLALVVSDIGGFSDLVEQQKNGYLVPIDNMNDRDLFKAVLGELLINQEKILSFKMNSKEKAQKFDLQEITLKFESLLNQSLFENDKNGQ